MNYITKLFVVGDIRSDNLKVVAFSSRLIGTLNFSGYLNF